MVNPGDWTANPSTHGLSSHNQIPGSNETHTAPASRHRIRLASSPLLSRTTERRIALPDDIDFLQKQGIGLPYLFAAIERGRLCGISASEALIKSGLLSEEQYYRCVAHELGLEFIARTKNTAEPYFEIPTPEQLEKMATMVAVDDDQRFLNIAPDMRHISHLRSVIARYPGFHKRVRVTTRSSNKRALEQRCRSGLLRRAIDDLYERLPDLSARTTITVPQALTLLLVLQAIGLILFYSSHTILIAFHLIASLFYLACVGLRIYAACRVNIRERKMEARKSSYNLPKNLGDYPVYSVLVALYKEAGQVDDLIDSLLRLDWPREKLEIKLICEGDDIHTQAAINQALKHRNVPHIELVSVPFQQPRTKPKALNYALPLCRGRYLVIYDAEDRPDPLQLKEAFATFRAGPKNLACLQAPLHIHNHREAWLARLFAIEYSTLFDGLLPVLSKHKLPLPLGGTSNHFKRSALESAGGWDPYNVTEDADLGMRLSRLGYELKTISRPTYEEAPISIPVWLKQRTRWFKGWLQTWLVHMRQPIELTANLGFGGALAFHIMITGMIVTALVHPLLLYFLGEALWVASSAGWSTLIFSWIFWLDLGTVMLGYLAFAVLAMRTLSSMSDGPPLGPLWGLPFYWLLLSVAAWRAVIHLAYKPHECGLR